MMPWDLKDYPSSFKNFAPLLKKKTIEIANALVSEGYPEDRAIPIAISKAKKWLDEATATEKAALKKEANPKKTDQHSDKKMNADLLDNDVLVYYRENQWYVQIKNAEKATASFDTKEHALKRAKEIAENKHSKVVAYKKIEKPTI